MRYQDFRLTEAPGDEIAAKNEKFKYAEQLKFAIPARIISYRYALGNI